MRFFTFLLIAVILAFSPAILAQSRMVSGIVKSSKSSAPLPDVEIKVKGTVFLTRTDHNGFFQIYVPDKSSDILIFSHPDHDVLELMLNGKTEIEVTLTENVRYNQYGVRVNRNPLIVEERNGILVHESPSQDYRFWFDARVQADGAMFFGKTYNPIGNGTMIRRARFATKVEFLHHWYAEVDLDFAMSELELKDAYLAYYPNSNLYFKAGHFKEGFSMEATTTSRYLTFMERPMVVNAFAPSRHMGLQGRYNYKWLLMIGGVHFQPVDDYEEVEFSQKNNKDFGIDEGYSYTGRLVLMPFYNDPDMGLHFAAAASYRTPKTTAKVPGTVRFETRSLSNINRKKYLDTDLIGNVKYSTLTGLEAAGYYRNMRLQGEYILTDVIRKNELPAQHFDGFYVMGSYLFFGGKYNYNTIEGEFTQVQRGKSWGDIELALRYEYLNLNSGFDGIMGGAAEAITAGLNYHANNNVKIMLNYSYLNHDRYASGKNELYVGYDANGNLTKDPKKVVDPKGKAGENFHMVSVRFEVSF